MQEKTQMAFGGKRMRNWEKKRAQVIEKKYSLQKCA